MTAAALAVTLATAEDAVELAELRTAAAMRLRAQDKSAPGPALVTERQVIVSLRHARVLVGRRGSRIVATLRLATKKPWAIDVSYFTAVPRAIYLHDMAVHPLDQRQGFGSALLRAACEMVQQWPAGAVRLDAYDHPTGAGPFYAKNGFREVGRVVYRNNPLIYYERLVLAGTQ